jgi:hypothetical protein
MEQIIKVCDATFGPTDCKPTKLFVQKLLISVWPLFDGLRGRPSHQGESNFVASSMAMVPRSKIKKERTRRGEKPEPTVRCSPRWDEKEFQRRIAEPTKKSERKQRELFAFDYAAATGRISRYVLPA